MICQKFHKRFKGTYILLVLWLIFVFFETKGQQVQGGFPAINSFEDIRIQFKSPSNEYAPHSFWFWNDSLDTENSSYMAREMAAKGLNPGYIHPRHYGKTVGLPIDQWLSEDYFHCIEDVLKVCDSTNTYLGFCDDYWWPSGRVGGKMIAKYPEMQAKELVWEQWQIPGPWKVVLPPNEFIVACKESTPGVVDTKTLQIISNGERKEWKVPSGNWIMYIFNVINSPSRSRGPDRVLVNYMEPALANHFIDIGLKPYESQLKDYMGKSLKYCFSDNEGEYGNRLPWSKYLIEFYEELYNDDIQKWMPLLFAEDNEGEWVTARYRWFNMISEMYAHKFWKPVNDWLAERGLYYVSNFWEANLMVQAATVGDYFRVNRAFSLPGNDCLMMDARDLRHFKEIQSVCEFENRPFMSEIMGVQGWQQTPTEMKEVANLVTAWGVTQVVPHGVNLNRDLKNCIHPADWFEENPYWQTFDEWTSFCKRASVINRQGMLAANVLIYNPMVSIWSLSDNFLSGKADSRSNWDNQLASEINSAYYSIQKALTERNTEYLIADDILMLESDVNDKDENLIIRNYKFKTLFLPPLFTIKTEVYQKILRFAASGGKVVLLGDLPVSSAENGMNDPVILQMNKQLLTCDNVINCRKDYNKASLEVDPVLFMETAIFKLHSTHRVIDGSHFYWLANNSGEKQQCTLVLSEGSGRAEKWNCETGGIKFVNYEVLDEGNKIKLDFDPYEGFWLVFNSGKENFKLETESEKSITLLDNIWNVRIVGGEVDVSTAGLYKDLDDIKSPAEIENMEWVTQKITWPFDIYGNWETDWIKANITKEYGYFVNDIELKGDLNEAFVNVSLPQGAELYINAHYINLPQKNSWKEPIYVDIKKYLIQGTNRLAVRTQKFISPGQFWMLVRGEVTTANNNSISIESGCGWLMYESNKDGWNKPETSLEGFISAPVIPWSRLTWTGKHEVHSPVKKVIHNDEIIWLKFNVPPGAKTFETGINLSNVEIWCDSTKKSSSSQNYISLKDDNKVIYLKAKKEYLKFTKPLVFCCNNSVEKPLEPWSDWGLERYSGFVEYEQLIDLDHPNKGEAVMLELADVKYVAEIYVNEKRVGARMWTPFNFDITDFIVAGENKIKIRVGNLIANRMALYDDFNQLFRWGNYGIPQLNYFDSGLIGEVKIVVQYNN